MHKEFQCVKSVMMGVIETVMIVCQYVKITNCGEGGEISACEWMIIAVHSVQSTMMGRSQHVGRL